MRHLKTSLIAAAALVMGAQASAAMVETWQVDIAGTWTAQGPAGVIRDLSDTRLRWGTSTGLGQSSLVITNPAPDLNVNTYVGAGVPPPANIVQTLTLTHNNNPITGTSLQTAQLTVSLSLTPTVPVAPGFPLPTIDYAIQFLETSNDNSCEVVTSPTPCNDIFVLTSGLLNEGFDYDGYFYYVNAFPVGGTGQLQTLDASVCAAAGAAANCLGFTTVEGQSNNLIFGLAISTEPLSVPEPAGLALVGLALAGAGWARRRPQAQA